MRRLQTEKYGWQKWLIEKAYVLSTRVMRRPSGESVYLEIAPRRHDEIVVRAA